jgi:hypothetical protein
MTLREVEQAEQSMQQQWHDLALAEQRGEPLTTLEQMYDHYILLVEDYNRRHEQYEREQERRRARKASRILRRRKNSVLRSSEDEQHKRKLAS